MLKLILLILTANLFAGMGQVFFKKSVNSIPKPDMRDPMAYLVFTKRIVGQYLIWSGVIFLIIRTVFWLMALAQADLNLAFSINSSQYIVILLLSHFLLKEKIDRYKLFGTLLIICGVMLVMLR